MPKEIFYGPVDDYGNGILLNEYNGTVSLVRANKGDKQAWMKWGFPQNGKSREPMEKAIPWGVSLGDQHEAIRALQFFLRQLQGDQAVEQPDAVGDDDIPF